MTSPDSYRHLAARLSHMAEKFGDGSRRCRDTLLQIRMLTDTLETLWVEAIERREALERAELVGQGMSDKAAPVTIQCTTTSRRCPTCGAIYFGLDRHHCPLDPPTTAGAP